MPTFVEQDFEAFYAAEYAGLARYCWRLLGDCELAHDIAQESFARMVARWRGIEDPRAYVFRVATNLVRRAWRDRERHRVTAVAVAAEIAVEQPAPDPEWISLRTAVEQLPRRLREVVLLHYFADLSVAEVANAVGRPEGSIKRQLSEARGQLAGVLEGSRD